MTVTLHVSVELALLLYACVSSAALAAFAFHATGDGPDYTPRQDACGYLGLLMSIAAIGFLICAVQVIA